MSTSLWRKPWLPVAAALLFCGTLSAQEAAIRKALSERLPQLPKIDEISRTPIAGLYEVRYGGTHLLYSDEKGDFVMVNGSMVDTKTRVDLTEARMDKLLAVDFEKLPLKDAMVVRQGNGSRRLAVFADPNCGYCKRFERDLQRVDNVTIYMFLYPILGQDSVDKSKAIWCAKDPAKAWQDYMVRDQAVPASAACDTSALARNNELGRKHKISGTPTLFFIDGTRAPGALDAKQVEKLLTEAKG